MAAILPISRSDRSFLALNRSRRLTLEVPPSFSLAVSQEWPDLVPLSVGLGDAEGNRFDGDRKMTTKRKVEVFSAGCAVCEDAIEIVKRAACPSCEVIVHDMKDIEVVKRAKTLGIRSVPSVVIDGEVSDCCSGRGIDEQILRAAGLGRAQ